MHHLQLTTLIRIISAACILLGLAVLFVAILLLFDKWRNAKISLAEFNARLKKQMDKR